jgi:uncharacterized protein YqgV (UPF0045/DUF77 family)
MLVAFSVAPSGTGREDGSVSDAVAAAVRVVRESGLPNRTDAMFTTVEGTWEECFDVVKRATDAVAAYGSRVSLVLKADIRPGYSGQLDGKVQRVTEALDAGDLAPGPE